MFEQRSKPRIAPPLFAKVPLAAVEVLSNFMEPPPAPLTPPPLLLSLAWSAVEVFLKCVPPPKCAEHTAVIGELVSVPAACAI